ncbi:MAG: hypothetical protein IBX52_01810 [Bacterioplanes sp.]|nr:hypothetical protein [Bacterioplanes sp.]
METPEEYIQRTESAVRKLFEGIDEYTSILRRHRLPGFSSEYGDDAAFQSKYEAWLLENESAIQKRLEAERQYLSETFAQGTLCGALLQVAAKAIECYSENEAIPEGWCEFIRPNNKSARFCIGRKIRGVPLGLVIYAARNQHTHFEDSELREPNCEVFRRLAENHGLKSEEPFVDPAFDLANRGLVSYASNCTALMEWRNYSSYEADIRALLQSNQ